MRFGDVDLDRLEIYVRLGKTGEGIAHFGERTAELLDQWFTALDGFDHPARPLFGRGKNREIAMSPTAIGRVFQRISKLSGVKVTPHGLRRFFATDAHRNGGDIEDVRGLMRHSSIAQTRDYFRFSHDDLGRVHRRVSPIDHLRGGIPAPASAKHRDNGREAYGD